jgi:hypothetical protein
VVDVSAATAMQIRFRGPDGVEATETAVFSTKSTHTGDGTDGWIEFKDTLAAYTDQEGEWRYWPRITITDGPFPGTPLLYCVAAEGDDS